MYVCMLVLKALSLSNISKNKKIKFPQYVHYFDSGLLDQLFDQDQKGDTRKQNCIKIKNRRAYMQKHGSISHCLRAS